MATKLCSKCGIEQTENNFNKNSKEKDGLQPYCRSCQRQYRVDNADKIREYLKQYRIDNADKIKEYNKQYREDHQGYYIYFIKEYSEIIYIGATKNLKFRVNCHLSNSNISAEIKDKWTSIEYIELDNINNSEELFFIEDILINEMCPKLNKIKKDPTFNDDVIREEELSQIAYEILDHLEDLTTIYKTNKKPYYLDMDNLEDYVPDLSDFIGYYYIENGTEYV